MTTITKEWLQKTITSIESARDEIPFGLDEDQSNMLTAFKIALASLEAKPIGAFHIAEQQVDGTSDYLKDGEWPIDNGTIEVYAAPPVPVVPEEKPMPNPLSMYAVDAVAATAEVRGWNACRAAMLHGAEPVSQTYKLNELSGNYPVTPDGWISCSERMPEMGGRQCYVLAADFKNNYPPNIPNTQVGVYGDWFNDGNPTWDDGDGEGLYLKEVTNWMPLPEPPRLKEL
ncbi:DUF551 domain-containing protein [Escherichia coli]|uniref:DUF551 domain-containing protein n=1 Tax=Escherichia coli TaxID=562 RepID=UPI0010CB3D72|nr:DUF551 domain-containing protein [Escherichia coli]MCN1772904.1 DUF551 domain-containing protein [Escherichia coli]MDF3901612.1 DUF551 domain-containing protein [Escherichia coli]GCT72960.1 hypothetical protein HmCms174_00989 [Escherichia coli]HAY4653773.1 DUF551 domain-containing protein [Escherichia coli]HAY4681671.1 DUF551 domain-containing protein [Escherichia coli]